MSSVEYRSDSTCPLIRLVPLAVFGVVAKAVGEQGLAPLRGLAAYVGAGLLGLSIH